MTRRLPIPQLLLLSGVYGATAAAAVGLTRFDGGIAFIWIATGVLIGTLAFLPRQHWPAAFVACFLPGMIVSGTLGLGWAAAVPVGIANVGEAAVAAAMLRRRRTRAPVESMRWLVGFVIAAGVVGPVFSAVIATAVAAISTDKPLIDTALHWYTSHALGNITFAPIAMMVASGEARRWFAEASAPRRAEIAVLLTLVAATALLVFAQATLPLLFLPLLPVILATFRAGRCAAAASVVIVAVIGGIATLLDHGPMALIDGSAGLKIQFLQFYLTCTVLTVLPVTADLARRKQLFQRLRDSEARYRALADHSTDVILNLDPDGRIRFASPSVRRFGGVAPERLVGTQALALVAPEYRAAAAAAHAAALSSHGEPVRVEYQALGTDGERRWFETHTRAVIDDTGHVDGVISTVRDIDARKALEAQLATAALTDPLTGLANRRAFTDALDRHLAAGRHGCVALFDLDHFKRINDRHGHAAGDAVLCRFAELARAVVRGGDTVARIGGEEFAILLAGASTQQAARVCERLRRSVADDVVRIGGVRVGVTVSGGVTVIDGGTAADILAAADAALYDAKRAGRDRLTLAA